MIKDEQNSTYPAQELTGNSHNSEVAMARNSINAALNSIAANFAVDDAEGNSGGKNAGQAVKDKENVSSISTLDRKGVPGEEGEQPGSLAYDRIEEAVGDGEVNLLGEEKEESVKREPGQDEEAGQLSQENRDSEEGEQVVEGEEEERLEEESGEREEREEREQSMQEEREEGKEEERLEEESGESEKDEVVEEEESGERETTEEVVVLLPEMMAEVANQEVKAVVEEKSGVVKEASQPEPLLEDANANIEMPAITLPRIPSSAVGMGAQNSRRNNKLNDPFGVQEVMDSTPPSYYEDSLYVRANYPIATTTNRVAAIKKKRSISLGNILFLICSTVVIACLLFVYFVSLISVGRPKTAVPTATSIQSTQPVDAGSPGKFAGAETTAPLANGNVLAGYQWIQDGTKHIVYVDANNHIQEIYTADQQNWHITDLMKGAGAAVSNGRALAGFEWQRGNSEQVVYVDAKGHIQQIYTNVDNQWNVMDLTRKAQAPLANGRAISGYEWTALGSKQVVYVDQNNHIQELMSTDGNSWHVSDLTALTKAPLANGNVVVGYEWVRLETKQVVYIDVNQHVQELSFVAGSWHVVDLHDLVGAPPAKGNTLVAYEWQQTGAKQIAYLDTSNHIQLLASTKIGNWNLQDLTQLVKAPETNGNVLVGYDWQQGGYNVLYFIDSSNHIQELSNAPGENWHLADLNQFTQGAPPPNGKALFGDDWALRGTKQVYYIDNRNTVQELTSSNVSAKWQLSSWKHN